ncbi:hypothetical protein BEWA_022060 [Theileria equi strain WA]|uniref:Uncharacterized protein n=1 Tax=Theileria equi strain WA TaxID=1537102 RepID=L0AVU5_THEEQ|nr:hypothetical protein BEWA_022060 [Theileria equi strain WA]AFZ79358.1 hypothetical protein BEWA_022060 [Theileria equi strain WA]|eukprot:XP_004829024.1 hypothetical protein BEWA_022060 [Theileria equi strain WA]
MSDWLGRSSTPHDEEFGDRVHLLHQASVLDESYDHLSQSRMSLLETNEIGANVMSKLLNQRDSIIRTKKLVQDTGNIHGETRGLIRSIGRSDYWTKVLMYITIVALSVAIICVLIYKLLK